MAHRRLGQLAIATTAIVLATATYLVLFGTSRTITTCLRMLGWAF